jgi:hypothetical protein
MLNVREQEVGPYTSVYEQFICPQWDAEHAFQILFVIDIVK